MHKVQFGFLMHPLPLLESPCTTAKSSRVVILVAGWRDERVIETNCIKKPERQPSSSSYNHRTGALRFATNDCLSSLYATMVTTL